MEHKHEGIVGLDGLIRCRTCGEILPYMEEEISIVSSASRARRVLDEIAVAGNYRAAYWKNEFIVYSRNKNGLTEEISGEKLTERQYRVYKRIVSTGT